MTITLTIATKDIEYEIANKTYLAGMALGETDNQIQSSESQVDYGEESHSAQIQTSIINAFSKVWDILSEYISYGSNPYMSRTSLPEVLTINLNMPSNFKESETDVLMMAIHKYIVVYSMAEWFSLFRPKEAEYYINSVEGSMSEIYQATEKRNRPTRK